MTLDQHALTALVNYHKAHEAWKRAVETGDEEARKAAVKVRQSAHSAMLSAAAAYEKTLPKER